MVAPELQYTSVRPRGVTHRPTTTNAGVVPACTSQRSSSSSTWLTHSLRSVRLHQSQAHRRPRRRARAPRAPQAAQVLRRPRPTPRSTSSSSTYLDSRQCRASQQRVFSWTSQRSLGKRRSLFFFLCVRPCVLVLRGLARAVPPSAHTPISLLRCGAPCTALLIWALDLDTKSRSRLFLGETRGAARGEID